MFKLMDKKIITILLSTVFHILTFDFIYEVLCGENWLPVMAGVIFKTSSTTFIFSSPFFPSCCRMGQSPHVPSMSLLPRY